MIWQLIANNVRRRPIRTVVSVIAVGVEVALVILIVGLTSGLLQETAKRIEGIGADIMLQPPSASVFLAFSGAPMPIKIGDKLRELKYVQAVAPVLLQFSSSGGVDIIYGIDPKSFRDVSGGFVFLEGHACRGGQHFPVAGSRFSYSRNRGARQGRAPVRAPRDFAGPLRLARQG